MEYRIATFNDVKYLDKLLAKLIEDEKNNYDPNLEEVKIKNFYQNYIGKDNHVIYLCEDNTKIVGYIYVIIVNENKALIDALFVEEDYRGKGIAKKLMDIAISYIKDKNIKDIEISVLSQNLVAKKLYNNFGFQTFKETLKLGVNDYAKSN